MAAVTGPTSAASKTGANVKRTPSPKGEKSSTASPISNDSDDLSCGIISSPSPKLDVIKTVSLHKPSLEEISDIFGAALGKHFKHVRVEPCECPDLRSLGVAAPGLGGECDIVDCGTIVGSMFNPRKQRDVFDVAGTLKITGRQGPMLVIGAAGGAVSENENRNAEWTGNLYVDQDQCVHNHSLNTRITAMDLLPAKFKACRCNGCSEASIGCIGQLMATAGTAGRVVRVQVQARRADQNWSEDPHDQEIVRIMRKALEAAFPEPHQQVYMGGILVVEKGKVVTHVMPPFFPPPGAKPGKPWPDMKGWSECFFVSEKRLVCPTTFVNHQGEGLPNGLVWRPDHTHFWSDDFEEGGHYHHDVDPEAISYTAYLVPADRCHKVEQFATPQASL